jgi:hypothetical protein
VSYPKPTPTRRKEYDGSDFAGARFECEHRDNRHPSDDERYVASIPVKTIMKRILVGLCILSFSAGLAFAPKAAAQTVTIVVSPTTDDSYWVWNDEYQVWIWNGPEFQGDYQGHPYSYWHGRHEGGGDRNHRPGKGESSEGERPVSKENVEQPKSEQPRVEIDRSKEPQSQAAQDKEKAQAPKPEVEKSQGEEKTRTEKPKEGEKSKGENPKPDEKKDEGKQKGQ